MPDIETHVPGPITARLNGLFTENGDWMWRGVDLIAALRKTGNADYTRLADQLEQVESEARKHARQSGVL